MPRPFILRAPLDGSGSSVALQPGNNIVQPWTPQQLTQNSQADSLIRAQGTKYLQFINSQTFTPSFGNSSVISVPVQNVGLVTKFFVEMTVTITNPAQGNALTRGSFAPWTALGNILYTDPNYNQRINTTGWHLGAVQAMRHRRIPGAAYATDSPAAFGSVIPAITAPPSIQPGASATLRVIYEVPLAYSSQKFDGAVYVGAVFATNNLQFTVNGNSLASSGTDPMSAPAGSCYTGASVTYPPTFTATVNTYQEFWDGFAIGLLAPLTPALSTVYELKTTGLNTISANFDNYVRFNNLRTFLSLITYYDNGGVPYYGSDINYFKLVSANQTTLWQRDPYLQSYMTRQMFGDDFPPQCYPFDFRAAPIITAAEGNTVFSLNPSSAAAGAFLLTAFEDIGTGTVLASAPSLSGNFGTG